MPYCIASSGATGDGSTATTPGIDTTGATLIVLAICLDAAGTPTVSDSKSNTWTSLTAQSSTGQSQTQILYCNAPTVGSGHTFTLTSTSHHPAIGVLAFTDTASSSPFDVENGSSTTGATSLSSGSITPSVDREIIVVACGTASASGNSFISPSNGFTMAVMYNLNNNVNYEFGFGYLVQQTAAPINSTWSIDSSRAMQAVIASFKPGASPSSGGETSYVA